jgi:hypothetical protein
VNYPRNQWYVAALDDELQAGQLLARAYLGESPQQRRMGEAEFWSLEPVLLPPDAGAVRARRKLAALIEAEWSAA